jgi:thiamine biosynthesis protein ThiI
MSLFLVRYGELGLKSPRVKKRFQKRLMMNIEDAFLKRETQCITSMDWGRIYIHTNDDKAAEDILKKIFGITSFSKVIECSSDIKDIHGSASQYSKQVIPKKSTFAVRASRTGSHKYSSQDVAKEVGSAILDANQDKNLKVNLSKPDIEVFVEIRHNRAFIFSEKIPGPGGFPMGSQGKVLAVISDKKSIYAAWLLAKRGCNTRLFCLSEDAIKLAEHLKPWNLLFRPFKAEMEDIQYALNIAYKIRAEALVLGYDFHEFEKSPKIEADIPIFYPLIGMEDSEIQRKVTFLVGDGSL